MRVAPEDRAENVARACAEARPIQEKERELRKISENRERDKIRSIAKNNNVPYPIVYKILTK
jgi:hypothetical protein